MSDEDHILNDDNAAADFSDTEQSYAVRLEKLKWGLQGYNQGAINFATSIGQSPGDNPELDKTIALNLAQQKFVDVLINHFKGKPPEELFSEGGEKNTITSIRDALTDTGERVFNALIEHYEIRYNQLRNHPVMECYKKLGSQSQRRLIKIAREMEAKENP